jgi:hypothetical protein
MPAGPLRGRSALNSVNPPPGMKLGEGGDYEYDAAHDFGAR